MSVCSTAISVRSADGTENRPLLRELHGTERSTLVHTWSSLEGIPLQDVEEQVRSYFLPFFNVTISIQMGFSVHVRKYYDCVIAAGSYEKTERECANSPWRTSVQ